MTTEQARQDVLEAAAHLAATWDDETDRPRQQYLQAKLRYEWPELAACIARVALTSDDLRECPSEYDTGSYDAGTVACELPRDHEGPHTAEGGGDRYEWKQDGDRYCDARRPGTFGTTCIRPPGHDGDHGYAGIFWPQLPEVRTACGNRRFGSTDILCILDPGHAGQHYSRTATGGLSYRWDSLAGEPVGEHLAGIVTTQPAADVLEFIPTVCDSRHADGTQCGLRSGHGGGHWGGVVPFARRWSDKPAPCHAPDNGHGRRCHLTAGHAGNHEDIDGMDWQQADE